MKQFLETLAVFVGNVLCLKATSWSTAANTAKEMRANCDRTDDIVDGEGKAIKKQSPVDYLLDSLGFVCGLIIAGWLLVQAVSAFMTILPYILATIVALILVSLIVDYTNKRPSTEPAPAAAQS
jgi:uncharacterized protein YacL